jgi:hypothetical protein
MNSIVMLQSTSISGTVTAITSAFNLFLFNCISFVDFSVKLVQEKQHWVIRFNAT